MKKFAIIYRHNLKEYVAYLKAVDFADAKKKLRDAFVENNYNLIDWDEEFSVLEKTERLRSAFYNGEIEQVVLSIPIPW